MSNFLSGTFVLYNLATILLVILSVILLSYIIERSLFLHSGKIKPQQFIDGVVSLLKRNRYNEAMTVCEDSPGVAALIVKTALAFRGKPEHEAIHAVTNVALLEVPLLERRLNSIRLIAKISPIVSFMGVLQLLANVLHNIKYTSAYFSSNVVLDCVQNALLIMAFGFAINIVGTLAYNFLYGRVRRLIHDMEWSCNEIFNYLAVSKGDQHVSEEV